jgi:hypothetical protein
MRAGVIDRIHPLFVALHLFQAQLHQGAEDVLLGGFLLRRGPLSPHHLLLLQSKEM